MRKIETTCGTYALLCAPGSRLSAKAEAAFREAAATGCALIYADHTVQFPDGRQKLVQKPDWSPDTLLSTNYIDGPVAVRLALLPDEAEAAFHSPEGRYNLMLRLTERADGIRRIPESLAVCDAEPPCESSMPLVQAIRRRRLRASVEKGALPGSFAVQYAVPPHTRVSCIVYGNQSAHAFRETLESVTLRCCWPHIELVVADSGGVETVKERYYAALMLNRAARIVRVPTDKGIANALNEAVAQSSGDALLFLPAGTRLGGGETVERMLEFAQLPHIGAVGGVSTERQNASVRGIIHDAIAIEDGPMMTSRDCYYTSGGFDETLADAGFIRAYTLLHAERRLYTVVTPYAQFLLAGKEGNATLSETNKLRIRDMLPFENGSQ